MIEVVGIEVSFSGVDVEGCCLRDRTSHGTRLAAVPCGTTCHFEFLAGREGSASRAPLLQERFKAQTNDGVTRTAGGANLTFESRLPRVRVKMSNSEAPVESIS